MWKNHFISKNCVPLCGSCFLMGEFPLRTPRIGIRVRRVGRVEGAKGQGQSPRGRRSGESTEQKRATRKSVALLTKSWRRGWDSNPRAPLLTGQVDFESTPLRPLRYLSVCTVLFSPNRLGERVQRFRVQGFSDDDPESLILRARKKRCMISRHSFSMTPEMTSIL